MLGVVSALTTTSTNEMPVAQSVTVVDSPRAPATPAKAKQHPPHPASIENRTRGH